jgi:hypothetical protein
MADYNINEHYSLPDKAKALAKDGKNVLPIIFTMNLNVDDFFKDIPFKECNRGISHVFRRDNEMAPSETRRAYKGIKSTKLGAHLVTEHIVVKQRLRSIDRMALLGLSDEAKKQELDNQDKGHQRRLGEDTVDVFFNGGIGEDGTLIRGLKERLDTISGNALGNVLSCGHSSAINNSRIYLVDWQLEFGAYGIYPTAFMGMGDLGVKSENFKLQKVVDPNDTEASYMAFEARHTAALGLAVGDNLKIACLANINTDEDGSNNFISGNGSRKIMKLLNLGHFNLGTTRMYCNEDIKTQFDILGNEKSNLTLSSVEVFGRKVDAFRQIPIRVLDRAILNNSCAVVS